MDETKSKSEIIKELALQGKFELILTSFDKKSVLKAIEYVEQKLRSLVELKEQDDMLKKNRYFTPFMQFAMQNDGKNLLKLGDDFNKNVVTNNESMEEDSVELKSDKEEQDEKSENGSIAKTQNVKTTVKSVIKKKVLTNNSIKSKENKKKDVKKVKKIHDPNQPKRAKTSFLYFCERIRSEGKSQENTPKILGEKWHGLSAEEKKEFEVLAEFDKKRYTEEMETFKSCQMVVKDNTPNEVTTDKKRTFSAASKESVGPKKLNFDDDCDGSTIASVEKATKKVCRKFTPVKKVEKKTIAKQTAVKKITKSSLSSSTSKAKEKEIKLTGFKQVDLPPSEDLLNSDKLPREMIKFPPDLKIQVGLNVCLILKPYREFIAQIPVDDIDSTTLKDIKRIDVIQKDFLFGSIQSVNFVETGSNEIYTVIMLNVEGKSLKVLYVDFSSLLLTTDVFLLDAGRFKQSLQAPWITMNAQVRKLFAAPDCDKAEVIEGSIYHINDDYLENPYHSVLVVWLVQENLTNNWLYDYVQMDNECSPWELELSNFVLLKNIKALTVPKCFLVGTFKALSLIEYLKSLDFASIFIIDISSSKEYREKFKCDDYLDLNVISKHCRQGRYDQSEVGISLLFDDLYKMVQNGKTFNDSNRNFQPWRLADMMEKYLAWLKKEIGLRHKIQSMVTLIENVDEAAGKVEDHGAYEESEEV